MHKPRMFCQLGEGLSDKEVKARLLQSYADTLTLPVHFVPEPVLLAPNYQWPRRGMLYA